jgi:hypothetical protein
MIFYRERADLLRVWGGAEIIRLTLKNTGEGLASNVRIELAIQKTDGVSATNKNDLRPVLPSQELPSDF